MTRWRVVVTDFTESGYDIESAVFAESGLDIDLVPADESKRRGLAVTTAGAHALLVQFATIDRALIETLTSCRVISRYGIGVDMIDLEAAGRAGIPVANVPDYCVDEVSTQTVGFLIDLNRRTVPLDRYVHAGSWGSGPLPVAPPRRLSDQTLGIVGLGAIGREVARKAQALGLRILACDPFATAGPSGVTLVSLSELLARSDYVTVHCPLNDSTRGLIGAAELATMKRGANLLNLSRGPVVQQDALVDALRSGHLEGAALDVLEVEPPPAGDPILGLANVIVTPHASSWSVESARELRQRAAESVVAALRGDRPRFVVNQTELETRSS